jgi:hypothetical protein
MCNGISDALCMVKEQDVASCGGWCHVGWRRLLLAGVVADGSRSHMPMTLSLPL